ncbi:MAG TPA: FGGY-family carbohydrate kinase [Terracidiphilus sp.]|nr:FGGY-family carbohydrate kinase [Terracidiphilus sp.]
MTLSKTTPGDLRARVAIDLGAESCRVSLLRWRDGKPEVTLVHRVANGPVHEGKSLRWPLHTILTGVEEGLRKAAAIASEGIASIGVDGWAVDYVRLGANGKPIALPFCYRDERTLATQKAVEHLLEPQHLFELTGAQPIRINTLYQLMADAEAGIDPSAPWANLPEYVLYWLGGARVAEYTNATHTGLVDLQTGNWAEDIFAKLKLSLDAAPPIVPSGSVVGHLKGPLAELKALNNTALIAPACHDTASAIACIGSAVDATAYIVSGTWSLVGTRLTRAITTATARGARYTNQGAAGGGFLFHSNVNGMWLVKQCMESWAKQGRAWTIEDLVAKTAGVEVTGTVNVDAEPLMLDSDMPQRINAELEARGFQPIKDVAGNEPKFARVIFKSLAERYASALDNLENMLGRKLERIHILGGGSRNQLLTHLTAERTGLPVETGHTEGSTIGNFAVQLASSAEVGATPSAAAVRNWACALSSC